MAKRPVVGLTKLEGSTSYAPLVAIGHFVRMQDLLRPLQSRLVFDQRHSPHRPEDTLVDLWLSMLTNCESVYQINLRLRPDATLARSWGRQQGFAEQSTVARVLERLRPEQVEQVRQGVSKLSHWIGDSSHHDWARTLTVDIDLTELPASAAAEGSSKGYFREKGGVVVNSAASASPTMMRIFAHVCMPATPSANTYCRRALRRWKSC
jgi:hypothetical protein